MPLDLTYPEQNRASTDRMRALAARLTDAQLLTAVGQHWTVAIVFAHITFWDRRVQYVLDMTERDRQLFIPEIDIFVNDLSLPLWAAIGITAVLFSVKHVLVDASLGRFLMVIGFGIICGARAARTTWQGSTALHLLVNTTATVAAILLGLQ